MKVLIAYASKYGCTEKCSGILAQRLNGEVDVVDLKSKKVNNLNEYDVVLVGGSIYAGNIQKEVKDFCMDNKGILLNKKIGLFICGAHEANVNKQKEDAFPAELRDKAIAQGYFGYEIHYDKMNFIEKAIMKMIMKTKENQSHVRIDEIENFANAFKG